MDIASGDAVGGIGAGQCSIPRASSRDIVSGGIIDCFGASFIQQTIDKAFIERIQGDGELGAAIDFNIAGSQGISIAPLTLQGQIADRNIIGATHFADKVCPRDDQDAGVGVISGRSDLWPGDI